MYVTLFVIIIMVYFANNYQAISVGLGWTLIYLIWLNIRKMCGRCYVPLAVKSH